jgi:hypothetical protein
MHQRQNPAEQISGPYAEYEIRPLGLALISILTQVHDFFLKIGGNGPHSKTRV